MHPFIIFKALGLCGLRPCEIDGDYFLCFPGKETEPQRGTAPGHRLMSRSTVAVLSVVSRKLCSDVAGKNSKPRKLKQFNCSTVEAKVLALFAAPSITDSVPEVGCV